MIDEKSEKSFYFRGKCFCTPEEMFKYMKEWQSAPLDKESAELTLKRLNRDIVMNIFLVKDYRLNNQQFSSFIDEIFEFSMKRLHDN